MSAYEDPATSFGAVAGTYEAGRPEYPAEAVTWLLEATGREHPRVADVGAGTGKLTRAAVAAGAEAVAIDPDPAMLAELSVRVPGVPTFVGTAENLPLPGAAVDALLFGQAWHWVDVDGASAEAARVLRAGGVLGLVWNVRDDRDEWVRELTAVMHDSAAETLIATGGPRVAGPFGEAATRTWEWVRAISRADFVAMVASRSYVITASAEDRARILTGAETLFDRRAGGGEQILLPYRTEAFRYLRP